MNQHDKNVHPGPPTGDPRDDFDDEFGRSPTRQAIRRKLFFPGVAIILFGIGGILATIGLAAVVVIETFFHPSQPTTAGQVAMFPVAVAGILLLGAWMASIIMGGLNMMRLRRHRLAEMAVITFIVITPFGCVTAVLTPLGVWALIQLNDPHVQREFRRSKRGDLREAGSEGPA